MPIDVGRCRGTETELILNCAGKILITLHFPSGEIEVNQSQGRLIKKNRNFCDVETVVTKNTKFNSSTHEFERSF